MSDLREAAQRALEALEIGYDAAKAEADAYHAAMAGYWPERHAQMDADVQKIALSIASLKAALEQPEQDVPETGCGNTRAEWADIPKEFDEWWDADRLTQTNPFREDSAAYWAWEGWQAHAALDAAELRRLHAVNQELLEALTEMIRAFHTYAPKTEGAEFNCVVSARAAIAKAEGQA